MIYIILQADPIPQVTQLLPNTAGVILAFIAVIGYHILRPLLNSEIRSLKASNAAKDVQINDLEKRLKEEKEESTAYAAALLECAEAKGYSQGKGDTLGQFINYDKDGSNPDKGP